MKQEGGGRIGSRDNGGTNENRFRCGRADHWSKECPKKESRCSWCRGSGHVERTCYDKENGTARGRKSSGVTNRGRGSEGTIGGH